MLKNKELNQYKEELYKKQEGICSLCRLPLDEEISRNHLDHDHALEGSNAGKVRSLLCGLCNVLEGTIKHKFNRSGLASRGIDMHEWLSRCLEYTAADYSENRIHPKFVPDKVKQFARLNKPEQTAELLRLGSDFDGTKAELVKEYRKLLRKKLSNALSSTT